MGVFLIMKISWHTFFFLIQKCNHHFLWYLSGQIYSTFEGLAWQEVMTLLNKTKTSQVCFAAVHAAYSAHSDGERDGQDWRRKSPLARQVEISSGEYGFIVLQ